MPVQPPLEYTLSADEVQAIDALLAELVDVADDPGDARFHDRTWIIAPQLPITLRAFLAEFRRRDPAAALLIHGLPIDDDDIGPTPGDWSAAASSQRTRREEQFLALLSACLGEVFSWSTLQNGRMIHNVLPIGGEEEQQSGHSSDTLLEWHTEDGFHPYRCDYLVLLGVRNHDRVPTTLASVREVELPDDARRVLAERRYHILPDDEHLRQLAATSPDHPALAEMRRMREAPEPVAVLFGASDSPYLRIDPFFMRCADPQDDEARRALAVLVEELDRVQRDVIVGAGSMLVVDNYLAVHGRRAFRARYDGTDRWLKKALVSRDLRKSRSLRGSALDRVVA